jgi:heat shock protein HslJ
MTRLPLPLLVAASAFLIVACSVAGGATDGPASLDGRTFLSTAIKGVDLVPDTQVRLSFADGNLTAQAGCNHLGGAYTIEDATIRTAQMSMTEMGCDEPLMRQDEWLAGFVSDVGFTLEGDTLTLTKGDVSLTLMDKEVVTPDQTLEGRTWNLEGMVSGDAVSSVPMGVTASLKIADGQVELHAGCNTGGGSVEVTPDELTFGPIATTKMACEAGAMAVETAVLAVLTGPVRYSIDADVLTIDADGAGLMFRAVPSKASAAG